jgi:ubiquinone/menaquinone biosynthesis C-methylase UbiE
MALSDIDYLAFSAHKMYAPFGSGALIARKGLLRFDACGHYTIPMAEQVGPDGRVYAVDIQPMAMETIQRKAARKGLKNITTVLVDSYDSGLPSASADIVVFLDAFHLVADPEVLLREIQRLLKPKGLLFMDSGHLETSTVLHRIENTGLFSLCRMEGNKIFLYSSGNAS